MFNFTSGSFSWDFGYNFWYRSCEKVERFAGACPSPLDDGATWALKGDAHVIGFENTGTFPAVRLAATQSTADIHAGKNFPAAGTTVAATILTSKANPGIDNPVTAVSNNGNEISVNPAAFDADTNPQTRSSVGPVFLTKNNIGVGEGSTRGISHKVFSHFSYTWRDKEDWVPYLGFGAEAEFGRKSCDDCKKDSTSCSTQSCDSTCGSCIDCSLSQWGIWIKGGVSF